MITHPVVLAGKVGSVRAAIFITVLGGTALRGILAVLVAVKAVMVLAGTQAVLAEDRMILAEAQTIIRVAAAEPLVTLALADRVVLVLMLKQPQVVVALVEVAQDMGQAVLALEQEVVSVC